MDSTRIDLVQREVTNLLQSALEVALTVVRANPDVLEGLGAQLEGNTLHIWIVIFFNFSETKHDHLYLHLTQVNC